MTVEQKLSPASGYEKLMQPLDPAANPQTSFSPNPNYERYLRMHKVFVGAKGASQLEDIYGSLSRESTPRYVATAGWAAVEAALVQEDKPTSERLALLRGGAECWEQALRTQQQFNNLGANHLTEFAFPYRLALDLAVMPLFEDIVNGNVRPETTQRVFDDCLNIAQANIVQIRLAKKAGDIEGLSEHLGFAYECNAVLAFNQLQSQTWFAIPSMTRSDTGYHHRSQTHDLLVVHQKWGELKSMVPVEIKATVGRRECERYQALLVRGKMHLAVEGMYRPEQTLEAITACHEGRPSKKDTEIAANVSNRFSDMVRDYYAGEVLGSLATTRSSTSFRDNSLVAARHPGLSAA